MSLAHESHPTPTSLPVNAHFSGFVEPLSLSDDDEVSSGPVSYVHRSQFKTRPSALSACGCAQPRWSVRFDTFTYSRFLSDVSHIE